MDGDQSSDEELAKLKAVDVSKIVCSNMRKILNAISVTESCCQNETAERLINETLRKATKEPVEEVDSNLTVQVRLNNVEKTVRLKDICAANDEQGNSMSATKANRRASAMPTIEEDGSEDENVREKVDPAVYRAKGLLRSPEPFPNNRPYEPYVKIDGNGASNRASKEKTDSKRVSSCEPSYTNLARPSGSQRSNELDTDDAVEEAKNVEHSKNLNAPVTQNTKNAQSNERNASDKSGVQKMRLYNNYDFGDSDVDETANTTGKPALPSVDEIADTLAMIISENANAQVVNKIRSSAAGQQAAKPEQQFDLKSTDSDSSITNEQRKLCGILHLETIDIVPKIPPHPKACNLTGENTDKTADGNSKVRDFLFNLNNAIRGNEPLPEVTTFDDVRATGTEGRTSSDTGTNNSIKSEQRKLCTILQATQELPRPMQHTPNSTIPIRSEFKLKNLGAVAKTKQAFSPKNPNNNYEIPPFNKLKNKQTANAEDKAARNCKETVAKKMSWQAYVDSKFPPPKPKLKNDIEHNQTDETLSQTIMNKAKKNLQEPPIVFNIKRNLENLENKIEKRKAELEWESFVEKLLEPGEEPKQKSSTEQKREAGTQWSEISTTSGINMDCDIAETAGRQSSFDDTEPLTKREVSTQWSRSSSLGGSSDRDMVLHEIDDRSEVQASFDGKDCSTQWTDEWAAREYNPIHLVNIADARYNERIFDSNSLYSSQTNKYTEQSNYRQLNRTVTNRRTQTPQEVIQLACMHAPDYATLMRYRVNNDAAIPPEFFTVDCHDDGVPHYAEQTTMSECYEGIERARTSELIRNQFGGNDIRWGASNAAMSDTEDDPLLLLYRNKLQIRDSDSTVCDETLEDFQRKQNRANKTRQLQLSSHAMDYAELRLDLGESESESMVAITNSESSGKDSQVNMVTDALQITLDGIFHEQDTSRDGEETIRNTTTAQQPEYTPKIETKANDMPIRGLEQNDHVPVRIRAIRRSKSDSCLAYNRNLMHELPSAAAALSKNKLQIDSQCTKKVQLGAPKLSGILESSSSEDESESASDIDCDLTKSEQRNSARSDKIQKDAPPKEAERLMEIPSNSRSAGKDKEKKHPQPLNETPLKHSDSQSFDEKPNQQFNSDSLLGTHESDQHSFTVNGGHQDDSKKDSRKSSIDLKGADSDIGNTKKSEYVRRTVEKISHFTQTTTDYKDYHEEVIVDVCKKRVCNDYRKPSGCPAKKTRSTFTTSSKFRYKDGKENHPTADKATQVTEDYLVLQKVAATGTFTINSPLQNNEAEERKPSGEAKKSPGTEGEEVPKEKIAPCIFADNDALQNQDAEERAPTTGDTERQEKEADPVTLTTSDPLPKKEAEEIKPFPYEQKRPKVVVITRRKITDLYSWLGIDKPKEEETDCAANVKKQSNTPNMPKEFILSTALDYMEAQQPKNIQKALNEVMFYDEFRRRWDLEMAKPHRHTPHKHSKQKKVAQFNNVPMPMANTCAGATASTRKNVQTELKQSKHNDGPKWPQLETDDQRKLSPKMARQVEESAAQKEARERKYKAMGAELEEFQKYLQTSNLSLEKLITYCSASHNPMAHPTQRLLRSLIMKELKRLRMEKQAQNPPAPNSTNK